MIPKILICDDDENIRKIIKNFLSKCIECDFLEAATGQGAIEQLKKEGIDLVFLDIKMPGLSGLDAIREVKKINPNINIIVITGWDSSSVAEETVKIGATDYITKPFSLKVVEIKTKYLLTKIGKYYPKKN